MKVRVTLVRLGGWEKKLPLDTPLPDNVVLPTGEGDLIFLRKGKSWIYREIDQLLKPDPKKS